MTLRALDLFCSAGGASMGLSRAGFDVTGVDIVKQPRYPFRFVQADALEPPFALSRFDFVWASPPCQAHTSLKTMWNAKPHENLVDATRAMLRASGVPFVIENVPGAPLENPLTLCGSMFGLGVADSDLRRHRLFETSWFVLSPQCQHGERRTIGIHGEGCRDARRKVNRGIDDFKVGDGRKAMGINWMTLAELCQAIPPVYSEFIGRSFLARWQSCGAAE